jgi:hypothetical protein
LGKYKRQRSIAATDDFYNDEDLAEINALRAEYDLRPIKQENCVCLHCGKVWRSPDVTNRRVCNTCHSDPDYDSAAAGVATFDPLKMFADISGKRRMPYWPSFEEKVKDDVILD